LDERRTAQGFALHISANIWISLDLNQKIQPVEWRLESESSPLPKPAIRNRPNRTGFERADHRPNAQQPFR
jgi:hypothetical protein